MSEVKWIKITTDIFDDEKILLIESLPDSNAIIVVWFKLLCLAGKQNNSGVFMMNDRIAYTDKMLATIFRMNENTVKLALSVFKEYGMIDIIDGVITIPNWGKHQNLDRIEANKEYQRLYQREYRKKQKALASGEEQSQETKRKDLHKDLHKHLCESNVNGTEEDKDKDKDKEKEKSINKRFTPPTIQQVSDYINAHGYTFSAEAFYDHYEANGWKVGNASMKNWQAACRTWSRNDYGVGQKKPAQKVLNAQNYEQRPIDHEQIEAMRVRRMREILEDDVI